MAYDYIKPNEIFILSILKILLFLKKVIDLSCQFIWL